MVLRPHAPWYDEKIQLAKQERRRAERQYKKTELVVHKEILKIKQRKVNEMCTAAKTAYYNKEIEDTKTDSKRLFKLSNNLLYKSKNDSLPSHCSEKDMANKFGQYFSDKIETIRNNLQSQEQSDNVESAHTTSCLVLFKEVQMDTVCSLS